MRTITLMNPSKETGNKLRWSADVDGVSFELYIPKWRVPEPWPQRIKVSLEEPSEQMTIGVLQFAHSRLNDGEAVLVELRRVGPYTRTVRYCPIGEKEGWELGEPYIPNSLLSDPAPESLWMMVEWDHHSRGWK